MKKQSTARELVAFSLPLIFSGILQQLYSWADAFIVGHSGETGELMLAAVGATGSITTLLVQTIVGFTLGLSIMAAQEFGKKNMERLRRITGSLPMAGTHLSTIKNAAYSSPHKMKFQLAPCHIPVKNHTARVLNTQRIILTRLPPRGIYT